MEEQEPSGNMDHSGTPSRSPHSPTNNIYDETGSSARNSPESGAKRPVLAQRLTEAFREGVASARPDYDRRPDVGSAPRAKNKRQESSDAGIRDRVIREGGSAAAVVGEKAAGVLGAFAELVKKAPALTQKYAEAFRDGAASVKPREGRVLWKEGPTAAREKGAPADGRAILDRVAKAGEAVAGFVRSAVSVAKPGEAIGVRQKIRQAEKKINQLYLDIGGDVARSWSDGLVETDKLAALLDEQRKSEEEILNLQAHLAEFAAANKTAAAGSPERVKTEAAFTPAADKEDSRVDAGDSGAKLDEPVEHLDQGIDQPLVDEPEKRSLSELENRPELAPDPVVADLSVSVEPDTEAPESHPIPEDQVDAEAAPQEESDGGAVPATESAIAISSLPADSGQEESDGGAVPEIESAIAIHSLPANSRQEESDGGAKPARRKSRR